MEAATEIFYCDLNGRIACMDHIGNEAKSKLRGTKTPATITTSLTQWEKMTDQEASEFGELVGLDHTICETCRYS